MNDSSKIEWTNQLFNIVLRPDIVKPKKESGTLFVGRS